MKIKKFKAQKGLNVESVLIETKQGRKIHINDNNRVLFNLNEDELISVSYALIEQLKTQQGYYNDSLNEHIKFNLDYTDKELNKAVRRLLKRGYMF